MRGVHCDVINLRGRLVGLSWPILAAVSGDAGAAVVHIGDAIWVRRVNPKPVMIAVTRGQKSEIFSTVNRFKKSCVYKVNCVCGSRVSINFAKIPGALAKPAVVIRATRMLTVIMRMVDHLFLGLDDRIDAILIRSRNGDASLPQDFVRQTISLR